LGVEYSMGTITGKIGGAGERNRILSASFIKDITRQHLFK